MSRKKDVFTSDKQLIDALSKGDQRAFEQIYTMCYNTFAGYVRSSGGTYQDAEDCFQEGVLSVWVNVQQSRYDQRETATFKSYVLGVCKYKWMNKMRAAYHKHISLTADLPEVEEITADEAYEERLRQLKAGLASLGPGCQEILRLFYFEKLSYEEMVTRLASTPESLKNQKYRCINRLRELMFTMQQTKK